MTISAPRILQPLRQRPVRNLMIAQTVSGFGDWAGRLALAILVYDRSSSALWAGAVTVVSLVPWLGPGQMLATFADRFGPVRLMVVTDIVRALAFAAMLAPLPIPLLLVLAFVAGLCVPPFVGARSAALVAVSAPGTYGSVVALHGVAVQAEILLGYAVGGLLIAGFGARTALLLNAITFVFSAIITSRITTDAADHDSEAELGWKGVKAGIRVWRDDPLCGRSLLLFVGVASFMILPEALVVPAADALDVPPRLVGALAALVAVGAMVGIIAAPTGDDHDALLRRTARRGLVLSLVTAGLFAFGSLPALVAVAYVVSGMTDAVGVPTNQVVGERLPASGRAAAMAVAGGALNIGQVVTITLASLAAETVGVLAPLTVAMIAAAAVCVYAAIRPVRNAPTTSPTRRDDAPGDDQTTRRTDDRRTSVPDIAPALIA
jgi:MFS family permease